MNTTKEPPQPEEEDKAEWTYNPNWKPAFALEKFKGLRNSFETVLETLKETQDVLKEKVENEKKKETKG